MYPVEYDTKVICETEREPDTHNAIRPTSLHGRGTNFKLPVSCMQNFDVSQLPRKQTDFSEHIANGKQNSKFIRSKFAFRFVCVSRFVALKEQSLFLGKRSTGLQIACVMHLCAPSLFVLSSSVFVTSLRHCHHSCICTVRTIQGRKYGKQPMKRIFHNYRHCGSEARQKPSWTAMLLHVSEILSGQKGAHTASKSTLSTTGRGYTRRPQSNIFIAMFDSTVFSLSL